MGLSMQNRAWASSPQPRSAQAQATHMAACMIGAAVLAHARRIALEVTGIAGGLVEGRRGEQHQPVRRPHQLFVHGAHRLRRRASDRRRPRARPTTAPPSRSAIRRSAPSRAARRRRSRPAGTRRHPSRRTPSACRSPSARSRYASASRACPRRSLKSAKRLSVACRNQPSHTLSPCPPVPTRFMPSFQSPLPISGRPCAPVVEPRSSARRQCSYSVCVSAVSANRP